MIIRNLTECAEVLANNRLCRLACASDGQPSLRANPLVSVLVEAEMQGSRRSVVIDGRHGELPDEIGRKRERDMHGNA